MDSPICLLTGYNNSWVCGFVFSTNCLRGTVFRNVYKCSSAIIHSYDINKFYKANNLSKDIHLRIHISIYNKISRKNMILSEFAASLPKGINHNLPLFVQ